jgi:hypothetical protein
MNSLKGSYPWDAIYNPGAKRYPSESLGHSGKVREKVAVGSSPPIGETAGTERAREKSPVDELGVSKIEADVTTQRLPSSCSQPGPMPEGPTHSRLSQQNTGGPHVFKTTAPSQAVSAHNDLPLLSQMQAVMMPFPLSTGNVPLPSGAFPNPCVFPPSVMQVSPPGFTLAVHGQQARSTQLGPGRIAYRLDLRLSDHRVYQTPSEMWRNWGLSLFQGDLLKQQHQHPRRDETRVNVPQFPRNSSVSEPEERTLDHV